MPLLDVFWSMLLFFLWVVWFWLVITVFADIFRSDDLSGWGKAGWTALVVLVPYVGVLAYLVARGAGMGERSARRTVAAESAMRGDVRDLTWSSTEELERLALLRDSGVLTEDEFVSQKSRILAA